MNFHDLTYLEIIDALRKIDPVHEIIIENESIHRQIIATSPSPKTLVVIL
ncbi:hypothetical protein [Pedobacter sp. NJ-S-72]